LTSTPQPEAPVLEGVEAVAAAATERARAATPDERIARLEARIASIEPLLEQVQANGVLGTNLKAYVDDLRAEQRFFNFARWVLGGVWLVTMTGLMLLLALAVFHPRSPLLAAPPLAIATFVVGLVSGIALLLAAFVRGVFRTTVERHAEGYMPPALGSAVETFNKVSGER
jgi:hypothetical protein